MRLRSLVSRSLSWAAFVASTMMAATAQASALERVARELAQVVGDVPQGTHVVSAPLVSDVPSAKGDELAVRLATLVAGRVGKGATPVDRAALLPVARGQAKDSAALLFIAPSLEKGQLRATIDLYVVPKNGWDRIRTPVPAPRAHGFATVSIDAEVRAFLPPVLLEQAAILKTRIEDPDVIAAACGDIDGDGGLEVALVSRARVSLGRFVQGRFQVQRTAAWSALAPRLAVPLREPIGTAAFVEDDRLLVGTTDRGGVALDRDLAPVSKLRGLPIPGVEVEACSGVLPEVSALEGASTCSPLGKATTDRVSFAIPRFDAASVAIVVGRDGKESTVTAAREPGVPRVRVRFGEGQGDVRILEGGAELSVFDFDLDGVADIALSSDSAVEDAINIYSLERAGEPRLRRRIPAPAPVRALAACPPEARGAPGLVAVVGSEVWLVR